MKKILALVLAVMMLASLAACGSADSDAAYITDKGNMVIGITLFAPMNYMEDGKLIGFETEFAEAVCDILGVTPDFQEIDWNSKEIELNSKNIDCIWNGMTVTEERKQNMSITDTYMMNKQVMVAKADKAADLAKSVDGVRVVAEVGSVGEEVAQGDAFFANADFTAVDSQAKAFMDVAAGTSDVAIVDYVASIGSIGEGTDFADLVVVEAQEFQPDPYGVAFRKGSDMTAKVNEAMKTLAENGTLAKIAEKYGLADLLTLK